MPKKVHTPETEAAARREFYALFNTDGARFLAGDADPKTLRKLTRLAIDSGSITFEESTGGRYAFIEWDDSTPTLSIQPIPAAVL